MLLHHQDLQNSFFLQQQHLQYHLKNQFDLHLICYQVRHLHPDIRELNYLFQHDLFFVRSFYLLLMLSQYHLQYQFDQYWTTDLNYRDHHQYIHNQFQLELDELQFWLQELGSLQVRSLEHLQQHDNTYQDLKDLLLLYLCHLNNQPYRLLSRRKDLHQSYIQNYHYPFLLF